MSDGWIEAFAPATVSNLGPGFDVLGLALEGAGDLVRARRGADGSGVSLLAVSGDNGVLPRETERNTASVAVRALLDRHAPAAAIELELRKGLPLGSGLGSSGASAAAAVVATNALLGLELGDEQLVLAAMEGERVACGAAHPDNVAPAIVGGWVLVASTEPLRLIRLPSPRSLWFAIYTPGMSLATALARSVLPSHVPMATAVRNSARLATLTHALHRDDLQLLGESMVDELAEPARAGLIPGFVDAKVACMEASALACSISGAGPTVFALAASESHARALVDILDECFTQAGVAGKGSVETVGRGARIVSDGAQHHATRH